MERELLPKLRFLGFSENWKTYKLGSFSDIKAGYTFKQKYQGNKNGDWLYIKVADIGNKSVIKYLRTAINSVSNEVMEEIKAKPFRAGCTVFPRVGAALLNNNKKLLYEDSLIDDNVLAVKIVNSKICEDEYFYYWFLTRHLSEFCNNGQVPVISATRVKSYSIEAPCLKEQQKITSFLSAVDEKIGQFTKKKALLEQYKKGVMQGIFSQEIRFKDNDSNEYPDWEEKELGKMGTFQTSSVDKLSNEYEKNVYLINYMDVYGHRDIDNNTIKSFQIVTAKESQIKSCNLKMGDILFTPSSETTSDIGHSVVIFEDISNAVYSYHLIRFRPKIKLNILFSHYFCNTSNVLRQLSRFATGSTRFTISIANFSKVLVKYPCLEEQFKIANFLSAIDHKITNVDSQIDKTTAFKKGLLQQLFV